MGTDPTPTTETTPGDQTPFVRVLLDRGSGRAVIALDRAAVDALRAYLDDIGPGYELAIDPGVYGLHHDEATRIHDVISRISGPLAQLYR